MYKLVWIYPNPASHTIIIEVDQVIYNARMAIFNFIGQIVLDPECMDIQTSKDISQLTKGAYFLMCFTGVTTEVNKWIKE